MINDNNGQDVSLFCPWMREECAEGKCFSMGKMQCRLWSQILTIDPQLHVAKPVGMCVFQAQLAVAQTQMALMGSQQKVPMPNLKIN